MTSFSRDQSLVQKTTLIALLAVKLFNRPNMTEKKNSESKSVEIIETIINTINHVFIGIVSVYMTWLVARVPYRLFNLHVIFTTLGYQLLMAEAILTFFSNNSWSKLLSRNSKGYVHGALQILGSGLALAGVIIEIYIKGKLKWSNNHVFLGLIATLLLIINLVVGVFTFYAGKACMRKLIHPLYLKFFHNLIGISCFVIGMITLYYGYKRKFMRNNTTFETRVFLSIATLSTASITACGALRTLYYQGASLVRLQIKNLNQNSATEKKKKAGYDSPL